MRFLPDWRQAWRWWSVRVSAIGVLLSTLLVAAPDAILSIWHLLPVDLLPATIVAAVQLVLFVLAIVARLLKQREAADGE